MKPFRWIRIAVLGLAVSLVALGQVAAEPPVVLPVDGYFSADSNQFVGFFTYILHQNVYGANGQVTSPFPTFLPGHLGLDAVDVLDNIDGDDSSLSVVPKVPPRPPIAFSTESNGFVWHAGGLIYIRQDLPYCLLPHGEIIEIHNWSDHNTHIGTLDALSVVPRWALDTDVMGTVGTTAAAPTAQPAANTMLAEASAESVQSGAQDMLSDTILIFSVASNRFAYYPGGQIYLRQQNAYAYDPWTGRIWLFFNGQHKGLRSLDAFDVELEHRDAKDCLGECLQFVDNGVSLGARIISTDSNQFAHGYYLRQNRAYRVLQAGGQIFLDPGADSLDAVSASGFGEDLWD